jgi:tetratricopeptide (TPR) repeat protein
VAAGVRKKLNEAIQAGVQRNYAKAIRLLSELIAASDAPPEAYLFLGRSHHALKEYSRALAAFNDFIRLRPRSPDGYRFAGRACLALDMPKQAMPLLKQALAYNPQDPAAMALLGTACLKAKHSQEAVDMLRRAVETAGESAVPPEEQQRIYRAYLNALFIRGIRLCREEQYALGGRMLRFVLENNRDLGDAPLLRLELGRACRELGLLDEAVEHYSHALDQAPEDNQIRWYRASILMSLGRGQEALEDIERIRARGGELQGMQSGLPWNSELVDRFMIRSFLANKAWRRAAESARNWLKRRPPDAMIHAMYGEIQRNLGKFTPAKNHLRRALALEPDRVHLWYALILTAWESEDWPLLTQALQKAQALGGDPESIQRFTALLESKTGDDDKRIIETLQNALRALGPEPELMYALAGRYLKTGLLEAAAGWFKKIILIQQDYERACLGLIAAYEALVQEGESAFRQDLGAAYTAYLERWPDNRGIRREYALFLIHTGGYAEAAAELERLLPWEPGNPTLRRVLAYAYRRTGRYREAAVFLKALLKEKPRDLGLLLEYTGCLSRSGAASYAAAVLEKAAPLFPQSPDIALARGILCYRNKQIERAFDQFREAAARNPQDPRPYQYMEQITRQWGDLEGAKKYQYEAKKRGP